MDERNRRRTSDIGERKMEKEKEKQKNEKKIRRKRVKEEKEGSRRKE